MKSSVELTAPLLLQTSALYQLFSNENSRFAFCNKYRTVLLYFKQFADFKLVSRVACWCSVGNEARPVFRHWEKIICCSL